MQQPSRNVATPDDLEARLPQVEADPRAWKTWWEELNASTTGKSSMVSRHMLDETGMGLSCADLWRVDQGERFFLQQVQDFARQVVSKPAYVDLLLCWNSMPSETREELALHAFETAERKSLDSFGRLQIPDFTLASLVSRYRDLLAAFLHLGLHSPTRGFFYEIHSEEYDRLFGIERHGMRTRAERFRNRKQILTRHQYLFNIIYDLTCQVAFNAEAWFQKGTNPDPAAAALNPPFRLSRAPPPVDKPSLPDTVLNWIPSNPHPSSLNSVRELFDDKVPRRYRKAVKEYAAAEKKWAQHEWASGETCQACYRSLEEMPEMVGVEKAAFSYCGPCLNVQRKMGYCSRDCQARHYKQHKPICGKLPSDVLPTPEFPTSFPLPPPATAQIQLGLLSIDPYRVYHLSCWSKKIPAFSSIRLRRIVFPLTLGTGPDEPARLAAEWREDYSRLLEGGWQEDTEKRLAPLLFRLVWRGVLPQGISGIDPTEIIVQVAGDWEVHPKNLADALDRWIEETKPDAEQPDQVDGSP